MRRAANGNRMPFYLIIGATTWCLGLAGVVLMALAARELGATPKTVLMIVSLTAVLLVTPCYLPLVPAPKDIFVLLPLPIVVVIKGLGALGVRWAANLAFALAVFSLAFGAGLVLLRPDYSLKRTAANRRGVN